MFSNILFSFLPVGHTHEDIDQGFSRHHGLLYRNRKTLSDLYINLKNCFRTKPLEHKKLRWVWDWKTFLKAKKKLSGHSIPLQFFVGKSTPPNMPNPRSHHDRVLIYPKANSASGEWGEPICLVSHFPTGWPVLLPSVEIDEKI